MAMVASVPLGASNCPAHHAVRKDGPVEVGQRRHPGGRRSSTSPEPKPSGSGYREAPVRLLPAEAMHQHSPPVSRPGCRGPLRPNPGRPPAAPCRPIRPPSLVWPVRSRVVASGHAHHGRDTVFAGHHGPVRDHPAHLHHQGAGRHEQRCPARVGGGRHEDFSGLEVGAHRIQDDPDRAGGAAGRRRCPREGAGRQGTSPSPRPPHPCRRRAGAGESGAGAVRRRRACGGPRRCPWRSAPRNPTRTSSNSRKIHIVRGGDRHRTGPVRCRSR